MARIPHLRRSQRRELIRLRRKALDWATALRFLMIAKLGTGASCNGVARELEVAVSTVASAARRYLRDGIPGRYDRRVDNGPPKVSAEFRVTVAVVRCESPPDFGGARPTWTRELLTLELARRGYPRIAPCTRGRVLAAIGARVGSPKPVVRCPWPRRRRQRRLAALRRLARGASPREPVVYADEIDLHLHPKVGRDWMLPGHQRRLVTPGQNRKHYLAGALDATTRRLICVDGDRKTSALFGQLRWRLPAVYPAARRIHLIVDNYVIHPSKLTQRCVASLNGRVVLHFLPPYGPAANRRERRWLDLHAHVTRTHRGRDLDQRMRQGQRFIVAHNARGQVKPALLRAAA